jgi:hypothetical protein
LLSAQVSVDVTPVLNIHVTSTTATDPAGGLKLAVIAVPVVPAACWRTAGVEASSAIGTAHALPPSGITVAAGNTFPARGRADGLSL